MPERADYHVFYKLDHWEDCLRRRMRFVKNPLGTTHPEAILAPISEEGIVCISMLKMIFMSL